MVRLTKRQNILPRLPSLIRRRLRLLLPLPPLLTEVSQPNHCVTLVRLKLLRLLPMHLNLRRRLLPLRPKVLKPSPSMLLRILRRLQPLLSRILPSLSTSCPFLSLPQPSLRLLRIRRLRRQLMNHRIPLRFQRRDINILDTRSRRFLNLLQLTPSLTQLPLCILQLILKRPQKVQSLLDWLLGFALRQLLRTNLNSQRFNLLGSLRLSFVRARYQLLKLLKLSLNLRQIRLSLDNSVTLPLILSAGDRAAVVNHLAVNRHQPVPATRLRQPQSVIKCINDDDSTEQGINHRPNPVLALHQLTCPTNDALLVQHPAEFSGRLLRSHQWNRLEGTPSCPVFL